MKLVRSSYAMLLSVAAASTASAQDPCRSLDPLLQSVGIIHEIEIESSRRAQLTSLQKLNGILDDISILDLYSDLSADEMDVHQSALIIFIGELNVAMEHAYSNEHDFALQTLRGGVPRLAREEITRLQAELSCNVSASDWGVTEKGFSALPVRSTGQPVQLNRARARSASRWMRPGNAGISYRAAVGSDADRSETLKMLSRYWPYIFIVVVLLTGLAIWLRRRVKRWKHRAERRICHQAVSVRLGRQVRQLTIVDFNVSGFRLKHDGLIKRRRPISLKFDEGWHEGQIVWMNETFAGVHLAKPLTDHEVERVWAAPVSA